MSTKIVMSSVVVRAKDQVSCDLAGEEVILHLESGIYYGLESVGVCIWNVIQKPTAVGDILERLLEEYDVAADQCERDLLSLLQEMAEKKLIEVSENPHGTHQ
jgi:hypothetical protein